MPLLLYPGFTWIPWLKYNFMTIEFPLLMLLHF
uniref:Uncharacterized protein n=1 Tax=Arundo donax TaxID=35708 RepID=A0A0A9C864_ARUDO